MGIVGQRQEKTQYEQQVELEDALGGDYTSSFIDIGHGCYHWRFVNHYIENTNWELYPAGSHGFYTGYWCPFDQPLYCHVCFCPEVINDDRYKTDGSGAGN